MALLHEVDLAKHRRLVLVPGAYNNTLPRGIERVVNSIRAEIEQRGSDPLRKHHDRDRPHLQELLCRQRKNEIEDEVR
ncbi:hypothetical protein SDC9_154875 [bioreactor metagenome]|uniref:Uncharacterized protein n=1 Tax=bioreactor metagenome TaxID=1076179 RepID=A0A645F4R7_9ZZZZ